MGGELRVLHVIDRLVGGGAEASLRSFLQAAAVDASVRHGVVALDGSPSTMEVIEELAGPSWVGAPSKSIGTSDSRVVRRALRGFAPQVVHTSLFRSIVATAACQPRQPHLHTLTSTEYAGDAPGLRRRQRLGLKASHRVYGWLLGRPRMTIHAVSPSVERAAIARFGLAPGRFVMVPRGRPDLSQLDPNAVERAREELRSNEPDGIHLIAVAREHPVKNHIAMLEVVRRLRDDGHPARFVIVGSPGAASSELQAYIDLHGLGCAVRRLGHRDDVPNLLAAADVLLCTSHSEGMPGGVIEAMSAGLPVTAFRAPGVTDALSVGHPGLVDFGDTAMMARHVTEVCAPGLARDASVALGRARYLQEFSIDHQVGRMHDLYRQLASS